MKDAIHRLTSDQTKLWLISKVTQTMMVEKLHRMYGRRDVRVCSATMMWMAYAKTSGEMLEMKPPLTRYQIWQVSNAPLPSECPCRDFHDEESGQPWHVREANTHHPLCQFSPTAQRVFKRSSGMSADERNERPDFMLKFEQEERARAGLTDGENPIVVAGGRVGDRSRH